MDEVKEELKRFSYNCKKLLECEEKLKEINNRLMGLSCPAIESVELAKYKKSPTIYKNNIIELLEQEESLKIERDYCLMKIHELTKLLQKLNDREIDILQMKFVEDKGYEYIAKKYNYSTSSIFRIVEHIITKMENFS